MSLKGSAASEFYQFFNICLHFDGCISKFKLRLICWRRSKVWQLFAKFMGCFDMRLVLKNCLSHGFCKDKVETSMNCLTCFEN